ncbi:MAG: 2-dehydro-3-deoxygluconate kinase [Rhizobium sp.]|nr:2-dehydro-3-deoxygluconate kinase [Rhizobium sp.]
MPLFLSIGECMIELASLGGDTMRKGFAGDTFNTAWYARSFLPEGWRTAYFTALGDDRASGEMADFMTGAGIDTGYIRRIPGKSPGLYMIHLDNGERSFSYWRSASAARSLADDRAALEVAMNDAEIIYFSGITLAILTSGARKTLLELAAVQKARGKIVAFDPNLRPRLWTDKDEMLDVISDGARAASIVMPGFDDEAVHFGDVSIAATVSRYRGLGAASVIVKDGANGATIAETAEQTHVPAFPPAGIVDTTSAGDSFNGGYLARIAAGDTPRDAAAFAARVASAVIGHAGALISRETLGV